jgi:hypothetical protein
MWEVITSRTYSRRSRHRVSKVYTSKNWTEAFLKITSILRQALGFLCFHQDISTVYGRWIAFLNVMARHWFTALNIGCHFERNRAQPACRSTVIVTVILLFQSLASYAQESGPSLPSGTVTRASLSASSVPVALVATLAPTLALNVSQVQLTMAIPDPAQDSAVLVFPVTSSWHLSATMTSVDLIAYFQSPQMALSDNLNHFVPSDHVLGGLNDQPLLPFDGISAQGTVGASRVLYKQPISSTTYQGSRTDTLRIRVRGITDVGAPSGNYKGILHLRLMAY